MTFPPFTEAEVVMARAVFPLTTEAAMASPSPRPAEAADVITPRDVALRLYDQGYVPATTPRRSEDLAMAILKAFEGTGIRFGDLPARKADFAAIRQHLEMITREAERAGRSLECRRYRPAFMGPLELDHEG